MSERFAMRCGCIGAPSGLRVAASTTAAAAGSCGRASRRRQVFQSGFGFEVWRAFRTEGLCVGARTFRGKLGVWRSRLLFRFGCGRFHNFSGFRGPQTSGALLSFGFPIGAAKPLCRSEIPFTSVAGVSGCFKIARQFERDHGVACLGKKRGQLRRGILAGTRPADASCDLLPVGHRCRHSSSRMQNTSSFWSTLGGANSELGKKRNVH